MPIRVLSDHVAAQIAAGEVIERPASVVKELIENALDAGATRIEVEIGGAGLDLIRVMDDGYGIPATELSLALLRHATSKLSTVDDLDHIQTLGFRGEALGSIASVARVLLTSHHVDEATGAQIIVEGSQVVDQRVIGIPTGTTVEVRNLFYNVPARRKFLKSETTERRHVANLITNYAMAYPQVRFSMHVDGKESFRTSGSGNLADVIVDTLGIEVFRDMVEILPMDNPRPDLPPIKVYGYTTLPNQTRSNRSQIILFVNGRNVQDQRLSYATVQAYHTLMPQGRYPVTVLMIDLPPDEVDVNVHPTKAEVRFRSPDAIFSAVQRSVRRAVLEQSQTQSISPAQYTASAVEWEPTTEHILIPQAAPVPRVVNPQQLGIDLEMADRGRRTNQAAPQQAEQEEEAFLREIPAGREAPRRPRNLPMMRVVGQIAATYIVAEGPAGMYLIDQHAAHERILFEEFMARYTAQERVIQRTLDAAVVELAPINARAMEEYLPVLLNIGFEIESFGVNTYRVRAVPAVLADHDPGDVLRRVLQEAESGDEPGARTIEEKILRRVCKTAAVKAGQILSYDEMQSLLRQLERCEYPLTCPHGRPTMIHMSANDLAREFGRT